MSPKLVESIKKMLPGVLSVDDLYDTCLVYPSVLKIRFSKENSKLRFKNFRVSTNVKNEYKEYYWAFDQIPMNKYVNVAIYKASSTKSIMD
jgi:hypothetical protein